MKKLSVITLLLACLLMVPALFLPLWDIFLDAPQYPEGLHMEIWLSKLGGDVSTISGLNHYIGMKEISEICPGIFFHAPTRYRGSSPAFWWHC